MFTSALRRRSPVCGLAVASAASCSVLLASACSGGSPSGHQAATRSPPPAPSGVTASARPVATTEPGTPGAPAPPARALPRCRTGQLAAAFTGLNAAMGGQRGMTLILTNHSSRSCYLYGYEGLGFLGSAGNPLPTHPARVNVAHQQVTLHPGGNAQAQLTWRVPMDPAVDPPGSPEYPQWVEITPPDAYRHLTATWPSEPVTGGDVAIWPLRAAPPGPVPTGIGTVQGAFNGMCMTVAGNGRANGTKVVAWKCNHHSPQQWTAFSDGTLRINGKCLDVAGRSAKIGATVDLWACDGSPSQRWQISQASSNPFGPIIGLGSGNVLTDPGGSSVNGTQLQMGVNRGDQSGPWHVSFHHYIGH